MKEVARKEEYLRLLAETARGVAYLHSFKPHPIIHRDLKPGNIFLEWTVSNGYSAKIGDFGLAKQISMGGNTASTIVAGTLQYMPFEWIEPDNVAEDRNNPSGDIWALGVMIYEIIEGKLLFPDVKYFAKFRKAIKHMEYGPLSIKILNGNSYSIEYYYQKDQRLNADAIADEIEILQEYNIGVEDIEISKETAPIPMTELDTNQEFSTSHLPNIKQPEEEVKTSTTGLSEFQYYSTSFCCRINLLKMNIKTLSRIIVL